MCNCKTICWDIGEITENGRFPVPNHHPVCEDYQAIEYTRISFQDGGSFICEKQDGDDYMEEVKENEEEYIYTSESVYLTRDQYEKIPEFDGF